MGQSLKQVLGQRDKQQRRMLKQRIKHNTKKIQDIMMQKIIKGGE